MNLTKQDIEIFLLVVKHKSFYEHHLLLNSHYDKEAIEETLSKLESAGFIVKDNDYNTTKTWFVINHDKWINHPFVLPIFTILTLLTIMLLRWMT